MADFTVSSDIDTFMQSADKAAMRTNMDLGTAATKDVAASGDAAAGEVVKGDDTRLTDARTPTSHTHTASEITDFDTEVANNTTVAANTSKLAGIEAGAEVNNISDVNATDLTDGGDSTLHYHSADRARANHTGTQTLSTISDAGTAASKDFPAAGDAAAGEVVLGNDSRLTDARTPVSHTHTASEITDFDTEVSNNTTVAANTSKLAGIEAGAEVNNISDTNATDLTDGGDSTLHYHSADRSRANHTGTQTLSTISDAGTIASQNSNSVTITGGSVTGITDLAVADGGTGASTAAAARTNLEVYSDAEVDAKVAMKATAGGVRLTNKGRIINTNSIWDSSSFTLVWVGGKIDTANSNSEGNLLMIASSNIADIPLTGTGFTNGIQLQTTSTGMRLKIGDGDLSYFQPGLNAAFRTSIVTNQEIAEIVITYDASSNVLKTYLNGTEYAIAQPANSLAVWNSGFTNPRAVIGGDTIISDASVIRYLTCTVNDFKWFNRALSAAEVADLYESGTVAVADRWGKVFISANLLNGGFETAGAGGSDIFSLWSESVGGTTTINRDTTDFNSGSASFRADMDGSGNFARIWQSFTAGTALSSETFRITGYYKVSGGTASIKSFNAESTITVSSTSWTKFSIEFNPSNDNLGIRIEGAANESVWIDDLTIEQLGCIADLPLDEGIGYQFHDRSPNHYDGLASTSGVTHLVPKTEGYIRDFNVDAYNGGSGNTELVSSSRAIIPSNANPVLLSVTNNNTAAAVSGTLALKRSAGGSAQNTGETVTLNYLAGAKSYNSFGMDFNENGYLSITRNNLAVTASDADATDLDIRVDYKIIE